MTREEAVRLLKDGLRSLLEEDSFKQFLTFKARFHKYSWHNALMILMQRPDATWVAGYRTWQELGRQVKKGEKGIAIFAPLIKKVKVEAETQADEEILAKLVGFRIVYVFDVSQTQGDPIPEPPPQPKLLEGDERGLLARLRDFAESRRIQVLDEVPILPGANGEYSRKENIIRLRPDLQPLQKAKTLAHELGHAILHNSDGIQHDTGEIEAESVAYVVMGCSGFDSGEFSFPYLARYTSDAKKITQQLSRILRAADLILDFISSDQGEAQAA